MDLTISTSFVEVPNIFRLSYKIKVDIEKFHNEELKYAK